MTGEGLADLGRRRRDRDPVRLERRHLVLGRSLAARDDRTGVTHATTRRRGDAGDERHDRLLDLGLDELRGLLLGRPADLADQAEEYRQKLIEIAVEQDDAAMEQYLEGEEVSEETLKACIRKGTINADFVPVMLGSAFKLKSRFGSRPIDRATSARCRR